MKCIECGNDAVFLVKGNSLCEEHLPKEVKDKIKDYENKKKQKKYGFNSG